ncbi:sigma-70 family RNA polymerase sigma factor [Nitrogeniibacter mangrovi]|uniref:Sigma-70 family RNA polymerase sigma factor n=1 Tax=Nitrogeniibacter mangrovi TaxID=2016596 RepID=A0A6C1AYM6_9RHOO|nr:sigma-70 family RNA polymerase sigma factor [Nitrogeniibacter mangrovi]QID16456.1 sigma-70 family RNA polymerase sigma factor [Nitrogeniibacter mangrovi]
MTAPRPPEDTPITALPDEELMLLVARGFVREPAAELFARHNRALFNFVAWLTRGDLKEAEDIAQSTWIRVLSRCGDYTPSAAFRTFLFQIARHLFLDARGSAWQRHTTQDETLPETGDEDLSPEAALRLQQDSGRVRAALMTLPGPQREAVALRFFADMSLEDIATTVGVGFETVKSRLRYAFRHLRDQLEPPG